MASSPLKFPPAKQSKLTFDSSKCLICQERKAENLSTPKEESIETLRKAAYVSQDIDHLKCLGSHEGASHDISPKCLEAARYHHSCYASYTSKSDLQHCKQPKTDLSSTAELLQ